MDQHILTYNTPAQREPTASDKYGNLQVSGDALNAVALPPQQPGLWTWTASGQGIVKVTLDYGTGYDPYSGFDTLSFTVACP